jgi:site-specific DNA-methyltransferase (adenine-specific)/adenine-specific DNA-methyltransferase
MSHLLRGFRGKVDLIYIDPPFDSAADYKRKITVKKNSAISDYSSFEEKQYTDIWTNDTYIQYIYERLIVCRELLKDTGALYLHCDYRKAHYLKIVLDEIFGQNRFQSEIVWKRTTARSEGVDYNHVHDTIFFYKKGNNSKWSIQYTPYTNEYLNSNFKTDANGRLFRESPITAPGLRTGESGATWKGLNPGSIGKGRHWALPGFLKSLLSEEAKASPLKALDELERCGRIVWAKDGEGRPNAIQYADDLPGVEIQSVWTDFTALAGNSSENLQYPTQKPEALISRIIKCSTDPGDLVFDCFMGSGTTQAVAMKLGRRFLGADINLGAIETTIERLNLIRNHPEPLEGEKAVNTYYTGFQLNNVNDYDLFRNPVEAKELIRDAMELHPLEHNFAFDGEKDGYLVKIMPVNRIATRQDLNEIITSLDFKAFEKRRDTNPSKPVERVLLVCMGHEPDLGEHLKLQAKPFDIEVKVVDILREKSHLHFKRNSEGKLAIETGDLVIKNFYPMNLLQKLSMEKVDDWRQLVETVKIDWNYDGAVLSPMLIDNPDEGELVKGRYSIPKDAGTIRVKITDLLSESWEASITNG